MIGRPAEALDHLKRALAMARELGSLVLEMSTLDSLAELHRLGGRLDEAVRAGRASLSLARKIEHRRGEASALMTLGAIHGQMGEHHRSVALYEAALPLADGNHFEARVIVGLAAAQQRAGNLQAARRNAERALDSARRAGHRVEEGNALTVLALVELDERLLEHALRYAREASTIHEECGYQVGIARSLATRAEALSRTGDETAADHRPC
jgi:tetratricopeptide (TPR) repeat protein